MKFPIKVRAELEISKYDMKLGYLTFSPGKPDEFTVELNLFREEDPDQYPPGTRYRIDYVITRLPRKRTK